MSSRHAGHAPTAYKGTTRRVQTRLSKDAPSGDIMWAVIVFVLVVAQGQIGFLGHEFPLAGCCTGLTPSRCLAERFTRDVASAGPHPAEPASHSRRRDAPPPDVEPAPIRSHRADSHRDQAGSEPNAGNNAATVINKPARKIRAGQTEPVESEAWHVHGTWDAPDVRRVVQTRSAADYVILTRPGAPCGESLTDYGDVATIRT